MGKLLGPVWKYRRKVSFPWTQRCIPHLRDRDSTTLWLHSLRITAASWDDSVKCLSQGHVSTFCPVWHRTCNLAIAIRRSNRLSYAAAVNIILALPFEIVTTQLLCVSCKSDSYFSVECSWNMVECYSCGFYKYFEFLSRIELQCKGVTQLQFSQQSGIEGPEVKKQKNIFLVSVPQ